MFVSHAKVRIVGLGGRSRKRRPHRRRLGLREMAGMPCLIPTALTVLLGLLAVAFGAGLALLGYLPTMDALVEVDHNVSVSGLSRNPNVPSSTTRSIASSTPNPSGAVAGSGSNDNLKNSIVFNSSAISSQTSITSDSSGPSFQTTGPKYSQLSVSAVPTHHTHRPKHHQHGGSKHHHHDAGDKSPDGILTATASFTTTASPGEGGVGVYVRRQRSSGGRLLALRACSYAGPVVMAIGMFAMIMACVFYCELLDKYAILVPDKGHGPGVQKDELYQASIYLT
ncbi:hypothetical protein PoB_002539900 [Plakobranchus ocellatus]|uniref:Uncharacterized protein n=1 Tax=Plakobranchus ocellatus TaxID=259542 RepID=A0AAV3ZU73_9GAST|nr:hypothetical protein PoB_002539900 [Plakobranchus ocellatus]